ncbi:MAG: cupin domain-containing protein [Fimbriimonadales bacterium]
MPGGYTVKPNWHSTEEHVTVLEGSLMMALSAKLDKSMAQTLMVGGYAVMPVKTNHFAIAGETGATIQLSAMGPFDINYVNPADDPRKGGTR